MKQTVIICDVCKEKIARVKCNMCRNDICVNCSRFFYIIKSAPDYLFDIKISRINEQSLINIKNKSLNIICDDCKGELNKMLDDLSMIDEKHKKGLTLKILKFMKENSESIVVAHKI